MTHPYLIRLLEAAWEGDPDAWKGEPESEPGDYNSNGFVPAGNRPGSGFINPSALSGLNDYLDQARADASEEEKYFPPSEEYIAKARELVLHVYESNLSQLRVLRDALAVYRGSVNELKAEVKTVTPTRPRRLNTLVQSLMNWTKVPAVNMLDQGIEELEARIDLVKTGQIQHGWGTNDRAGSISDMLKQIADDLVAKESEKAKVRIKPTKQRRPTPPNG